MNNKSTRMPIVSAVMCGLATILGIIILVCVALPIWALIVLIIMLFCNCVCIAACAISHGTMKNLVESSALNQKYYLYK